MNSINLTPEPRGTTTTQIVHGRRLNFSTFRDLVLGYDLFISYAWNDGRNYAKQLRNALISHHFSVFLDDIEMAAGSPLSRSVSQALRRSSSLVLVTTPHALISPYVHKELSAFSNLDRPLVPIVFQDTEILLRDENALGVFLEKGNLPVASEDCWQIFNKSVGLLRDRIWVSEPRSVGEASPSDTTVEKIRGTFRSLRRGRIRQAIAISLIVLFAVLSLIAERQRRTAQEQRRIAEQNEKVAEQQRKIAVANEDIANQQRDIAVANQRIATAEKNQKEIALKQVQEEFANGLAFRASGLLQEHRILAAIGTLSKAREHANTSHVRAVGLQTQLPIVTLSAATHFPNTIFFSLLPSLSGEPILAGGGQGQLFIIRHFDLQATLIPDIPHFILSIRYRQTPQTEFSGGSLRPCGKVFSPGKPSCYPLESTLQSHLQSPSMERQSQAAR